MKKLMLGVVVIGLCGAEAPPRNVSMPITKNKLPLKVHVMETYETDIEKRWWLRGSLETNNVPASLSDSVPNRRAFRAGETKNFDRKMGDQTQQLKAVIFNPVPGPPMGDNTRLTFRYWLKGTDSLQVQIYSLTNNYHRFLTLTDLPQNQWQSATVDMTKARRPDGSGGPLSRDERIDDIQFYITPEAELLIDDIVLYDAAPKSEMKPFPRRVIFTGWFDTGKQGKEWPGDFEIVLHKKPFTWDAVRSVINPKTQTPWIRVHLRGPRFLSETTHVRFRYKLEEGKSLRVELVNTQTNQTFAAKAPSPITSKWTETTLKYSVPRGSMANEIRFLTDQGADLLIDDVLIFEPGLLNEK